ncbi:MAG: 1-acyl-sn-glycerol-3-phosphate acyltransferase [Fibrobacter sp.]|jgi:1-acyl-sn-glycerol-3-phosphate acyltransferase|uniref:lysophospholipid acyltransferase family protein n=1 Tax=uncultured Fibrobacter sp. TaxID=261512 RepID=UPI0015662E80|nr:lysophospholipid acyltransferase family protein [uncultured Fibrobacter sp.]MBQ1824828.1 1-acyl-sn-glycerol-3-phosphate acyltransferase [Fibrobacter sp.]
MIEKAKNIVAGLFWKLVLVVVVYGVRFYLLLFYRPKMTFLGESVKSTKLKQPMVIIANHTSMLDPLMVQALFFHKRSIVVAKDQVEDPHFRWALSRFKNVVPCDRFNLDTEWALLAKKELEKGNSVIIFPEGKCRYDGLLNEFKTGFAFLARSTGAPVLSLGIDGIYKVGHRTRVVVGEPETIERVKGVPSSKHLAERSEYFRQKIWGLKQQALGKTEIPELPCAAETPAEVLP